MVVTYLDNTNPSQLSYLATSLTSCQVKGIFNIVRDCCECCGCAYIEQAFVKENGKAWETDKSTFLFSKVITSDTIVAKLYKNGTFVMNVDNTIGQDFSNLPSELYVGYLVDWYMVKALHGYGMYSIKVEHTNFGNMVTWDSHYYNVVEYNECRAEDTVKIETYQTGEILDGFVYDNWYQSVRVKGFFGLPQKEFESENYQNSQRELTQIQDKITTNYRLILKNLPTNISNIITYQQTLANNTYITDYNSYNNEKFTQKQVQFLSYENVTHGRNGQSHILLFRDKLDNKIKR